MFNVGGPEIVVILLVALVILGPDQLPKAMRTVGNVMAEIRKVSTGFQSEMRNAMNDLEGSSDASPPAPVETTARTMAEADVTEVVARNPAPTSSSAGEPEPGPVDPVDRRPSSDPAGPVEQRPAIDPADRAAG